jgi:hypothetical protein
LMNIMARTGKSRTNAASSKIISLKARKKRRNWEICSRAKILNTTNSETSTQGYRWKPGRRTSLSLMRTSSL